MKKFSTKTVCIAFMTMLCAWNLNAQVYNIITSSNPEEGGFAFGTGLYGEGTSSNVWAGAFPGYTFINWTEEGTVVSTDEIYIFIVTKDRTLVANFFPMAYEIIVSANPPEGGTVVGDGSYNYGQEATVLAEPNVNYTFVNWTNEYGTVVSTDPVYTFTVNGPRSLVANFVPATCEIKLSKNIEEGGTVVGDGVYSYGQTVVVCAYHNLPVYEFENWTEDGNVVSIISAIHFPATQSRHLVANFQLANYHIPVYANPLAGGNVTGGGTYHYGDHVTISATAKPGYQFLNWTQYILGTGTVVSTEPTYTYEVAGEGMGNCAFVAYFAKIAGITVLVNVPGGEVLGGGVYHYGDEVTVEAIPYPGYVFTGWTEGRGVVSTDNPYSFTVTEDRILIANFEEEGALSIEPIDAGAMMIYPNPTTSDMTVVLNDHALKIVEIELYDLAGRKVHQQTVNQSYGTLRMSELAQGTYVLKVYLNQGDPVIQKVVKQ